MNSSDVLTIEKRSKENELSATDDHQRRYTDRLPHRPVTLKVVFTFLGLTFGPLIALQVYIADVALDARLAAASSRPNPYTSINAAKDWNDHLAEHAKAETIWRREVSQSLTVMQGELSKDIQTLERPPAKTVRQLDDMAIRLVRLEVLLTNLIEQLGYGKQDLPRSMQ